MTRWELAVKATKEAAEIVRRSFGKKGIKVKPKEERDIVLDVDFMTERLIVGEVKKYFGRDGILSEEAGETKGESDYRWVIDPLDGTVNFRHGSDRFCVAVAFEKDKKVIMAVIALPLTGDILVARKGKGAWLNDTKIRVSEVKALEEGLVVYGSSRHKDEFMRKEGGMILTKLLGRSQGTRLTGSSLLDLADVARGRFVGMIKPRANYWDFAAGALIVEEAGGKVTDFKGAKWGKETNNVVASNGWVHEQLLKLVKEDN